MHLTELPLEALQFRTSAGVEDALRGACAANPDVASFHDIGRSREGRRLYGATLGFGPEAVTLVAGAHADEPVGPETLRTLILEVLANRDWLAEEGGFADMLARYTFRIVPHVNPDGEERNQAWITHWPSLERYILHRVREQPGDDIEFGYPVMRPENRAASRFLFDYDPVVLHVSLHGMGFAEGALLLIERHWADRSESLKHHWRSAVAEAGLGLHDHDRRGEKGFRYYGPGFWSTPEGAAMRRHFLEHGDRETANRFFHSSMEWARLTGYDAERGRHPLALVTELPLFLVERDYAREPGVPAAYLELEQVLPDVVARAREGEDVAHLLEPFHIRPLPLEVAVRLQLRALELGLQALAAD